MLGQGRTAHVLRQATIAAPMIGNRAAAVGDERVVVVAKADNEDAVAILPLDQFLAMESLCRLASLL